MWVRVWGPLVAGLTVMGCDTSRDPVFSRAPAVVYPDRGSDASVQRPDRPRIDVQPNALRFLPDDASLTLRLRSTGARPLLLESLQVPRGFEVWLGEVNLLESPEGLADPDGDGLAGLASGRQVSLRVARDALADNGALQIASNDPELPLLRVPLWVRDPVDAAVLDAAVDGAVDAAPDGGVDQGPDGTVDAGPLACDVDEDCVAAVALEACEPCPVPATTAMLAEDACLVRFEPNGLLFNYLPVACTAACSVDVRQQCGRALEVGACEAGGCVLLR
jgi:hypothetical protein